MNLIQKYLDVFYEVFDDAFDMEAVQAVLDGKIDYSHLPEPKAWVVYLICKGERYEISYTYGFYEALLYAQYLLNEYFSVI